MVSFAYPDVGGDVRADLLTRLRSRRRNVPAFVLPTCLRLEVMAAPHELDDVIPELLGPDLPPGRRFDDLDAVRHLMRVSAGLESPIVGELEVFTQFRKAVAQAKESGLDPRLGRLLEQAIAAGRRARAALPGSPRGSLASVAARLVAEAPRVAVLGAGEMAAAAVAALQETAAAPEVVVVARDPGKVRVAETVWGFDRAEEVLASFPAVISATSAKRRLVPDDRLAEILAQRSSPLVLVDLAMPPDFRPPRSSPVTYVDIDMLAGLVSERLDVSLAEAELEQLAADAWRRFRGDAGPSIAALYSTADQVVDRAVERFAGRLTDPADVEVLRQTARSVARTLLAGPVERINDQPDSELAAAITDAFALER